MKQYIQLVEDIKKKGTPKPPAREGMPGSKSLFGYQMRFNLKVGFPILTTKKVSFKNIAVELLWFLKGDTNIKYLVDNGCNIWNEDAYNYYLKICTKHNIINPKYNFKDFVLRIKGNPDYNGQSSIINSEENILLNQENYHYGDCGYQYGKVWRDWTNVLYNFDEPRPFVENNNVDQVKKLIRQLRETPDSRRHIVTAIDPAHDTELALYWCHALTQWNCRPLMTLERLDYFEKIVGDSYIDFKQNSENMSVEELNQAMSEDKIPKYYLDCLMYQRSADTPLGVPYNISSYCLLLSIFAKILNMIPADYIHTFGDVHIYDNQYNEIDEQLQREPLQLPTLEFSETIEEFAKRCLTGEANPIDFLKMVEDDIITYKDFKLVNYKAHDSIKYKLSTGTGGVK